MKKRILAMLLTAAMLLGMLPTVALAEDAEPGYVAAYTDGITLDGQLAEGDWLTDGFLSDGSRFGILWDGAYVYIGVAHAGALTVQLGDATLTVAEDGTASGIEGASAAVGTDAAEVKIPYAVTDYSDTAELTLTQGSGTWTGTLSFSSLVRENDALAYTIELVEQYSSITVESESLGGEEVTGGFRMWNRYAADSASSANSGSGRVCSGTAAEAINWLADRSTTLSLEYDFVIYDMPEYESWEYGRSYSNYGFSMGITSATKEGYISGITNTPEGLRFVVMKADSEKSVLLNRNLGDTFHIRQDWTMNGDLAVYLDGALLHTFTGVEMDADTMGSNGWPNANVMIFNLWADERTLASEDDDIDFAYSNLRMGKVVYDHALDGLDFNTIKGSNTDVDSVKTALTLPSTWSNGHLPEQEIVWSSSAPQVITAAGAVTRPVEDTEVTLTAALASDPTVTKEIKVTVSKLALESVFTDAAITLDGARNSTGESWPDNMATTVYTSSTPFGGVASQWYQEKLYIFINHARTPETVKLSIADKSWTIDMTQASVSDNGLTGVITSSTMELCLDLKAAGLKLYDYGVSYDFQVELTNSAGTAKLYSNPIKLDFVIPGNTPTAIGSSMIRSGTSYLGDFTRSSNGLALDITKNYSSSSCAFAFTNNLGVDHSKDVRFDQTLTITNLPVTNCYVFNRITPEGYFFILCDKELTTDDAGKAKCYKLTTASIYNSGSNGLVLRILRCVNHIYTEGEYTDIPLGKQVGDTFTLGYRWGADDTATVYVNGVQVGDVVSGVTYITDSCIAGDIKFGYYHIGDATARSALTVTDMAYTVLQNGFDSIKQEITQDGLLGDTDLTAVSESLALPQSYTSKYLGELPLTWVSDDTSVIAADGTVNRPAGTVGKYVALSLYVGQQKLFTVYPYVLPETVVIPTSPTTLGAAFSNVPVTVDGATTDEGWSMNTKLQTASGKQLGRMGAQWNVSNLYLAIETGGEDLSLTLDGKSVDLTGAVTANNVVEIAIPFDSVITEYGREIAAAVTLGDASWEGTIVLTSADWFVTGSTAPYPPTPIYGSQYIEGVGSDSPTANQGVKKLTDGWQFFDTYDPEGSNPRQVRTYLIYGAFSDAAKALYTPFADRTVASFVEFDFYAASMPEYTLGEATGWDNRWACYGLSWLLTTEADSNNSSDTVSVGIYNSADGLVFVALGEQTHTIKLNRHVGDLLRIGVRWNVDGSISVFLDGEKLADLDNMTVYRRAMGSTAVNLNLIRSASAAESFNDNFDISVTNLAFGKAYGDQLIDSLTFNSIRGENTDPYAISSDLTLPEKLANAQLDPNVSITWTCSDPALIAADGTVTLPEYGKLVTLTAEAANGDSKTFELYVTGTTLPEDVLFVEKDADTANGVGRKADFYRFTLDATNNSVIRDLKESKTVNVIALHDSDAENRLNESVLTVWVSDDNIFYTKVDSFKLLRAGETVYLYDFEATGRYIKVHCTHLDGTDADFTAPLQTMIDAYYEDTFGANGGTFSESTVTVTNSSDAVAYDKVWTLEGEYQRVLLNGEYLYHYTEDGKTYVRIPTLAAGDSVTLTVLSGNADAMDISNKEYTLEVVYGTREIAEVGGDARWIVGLPDGRMLNVMSVDEDEDGYSGNYIGFNWSYDGGLTWTDLEKTGFGYEHCVTVAGVMYDPDVGEQGRIIVQGFSWPKFQADDGSKSDCKTRFLISDDLGDNWYAPAEEMTVLGDQAKYILSYTAPYKVSTADGEGEGVDYVIPLAAQPSTDTAGSFVGRVAYSCDGGLSWTMGASELAYTGEGWYAYEVGVSEGTIIETEDHKLVFYGRCQYDSMNYFAMATSEDFGKTWTEAESSSVYTVNTQPMFQQFGDTQLLTWAGNTALGGNSYRRYPLNVAYSTDGLQTFENIQNLWSRLSFQGLTEGDNLDVTNQSVATVGDSLMISWSHYLLKTDHFTDYFFRTKGAYDSFETATTKYEGWSTTIGTVSISSDIAYQGSRSMQIVDGSSAVRSIPYVQDGTVAFDLYLEDLDGTLQIELESAYSDVFGEAAPIALEISDGKLNGLSLTEGWNKIAFDLALTEGTASLTVNGETAQLTPDTNIGDYICYVEIGNGTTVCYVDEFQVVDNDPQTVPEAPESPIPQQEPEVAYKSVSLKGNIGVNYYMTLPQDVASDENAYMQFTVEGKEPVRIPVADAILETVGNKAYYVFTCQVAAKEMNDIIEATFVYGDGQTIQVKDFSVRAYADQILADTSGEYDDVKPLVEAMLRYGAYAQLHFDYNTEETADVDMGTAAISAVTAETLAAFAGSGTGTEDAAYCGNSLLLKSETSLRFFFQVAEGETLAVTCGEKTLPATERNGMHYVAVENISAKDLDTKYTLNANGAEITASALTYAYNVLSAADGTYDDNLENLVKALYLYNQAANTYFDNN